MRLLEWNGSLEIGVAEIDSDHRGLVDLVNAAGEAVSREADKKELWEILKRLESYTIKHFEREEALMATVEFEFLDSHVEEHERLRAELKTMFTDFLDGKKSGGDIYDFMVRWLIHHIAGSDTLIGEAVKRRG